MPEGSVRAEWNVVATDAYSNGPWQVVRDEQVHLPYFNFATRLLDAAALETILIVERVISITSSFGDLPGESGLATLSAPAI